MDFDQVTASLAVSEFWQHLVAMHDHLAEAIRKVFRGELPCSNRQLALLAGVPASTISRIRSGDRRATREVVERLADALGEWSEQSSSAERILRTALEQGGAD